MLKQIAASFIGAALAFALIGGVGYVAATSYIDNKMEIVETVANISAEKIEAISVKVDKVFTVVQGGIGNVDDAVTNSKVYERFFGNKENEEPAN